MLLVSAVFLLFLIKNSSIYANDTLPPLRSFETLNYNDFEFKHLGEEEGERHKRSASFFNKIKRPFVDNNENKLTFYAFNQSFEIFLSKKMVPKLISDNFDIEVINYNDNNKQNKTTTHHKDFFTNNYYNGYVNNVEKSSVLCYFETSPINSTS
jgi:hypothetical protein